MNGGKMKKIIDILNKIEEWFLIILMCAISVVVIMQVIWRKAGASLSWSEELARYLMVWISFVGASYGFRFGVHIGVEAFKTWLPYRIERIIDLIADVVIVVLSAMMVKYGIDIIVNVHLKFGQVSPAMRMPMWIAYAAVPVGFTLIFFRNIGQSVTCVKDIIRGKKPEDPEAKELEGGNE